MRRVLYLAFLLLAGNSFSQSLVINEIMASNQNTIDDEDGNASDYIELYNGGTAPVQLEGYGLSDDPAVRKWQFGSAVLNPGGYLLVFASDKNKKATYWHTNFKISAAGESIVLSDPAGVVVDRVDAPAMNADIAWGRIQDGAATWVFQTASPGGRNTGRIILPMSAPVAFTPSAGFYPAAVSITLKAGGRIFYTLDGSDPDSTSTPYSTPVVISKTAVLKAVSIEAGHQFSPMTIQSYFINETTDLPVVSLSSDPGNLFDYNYGIYANGPGWTATAPNYGANFWMDWERPAHVEFFEDDKQPGFAEHCGIAIYGAYTRSFPQKSIAVKFKNDYGVSGIDYPLFPGFWLTTFKGFVLRNSGNDFYYTHIRDAMMQSLVKDLDVDYLEYRPAAAFINGEYWGIYNIREKINEHYVANRHGVDPDQIDMLEGNMEVIHGDATHYQRFIDYISTQDMTSDSAYARVNRMIDLDECLLYFAAEVYYNSQDWPANNMKYWRERSATGKWRWILFDLDFGFNLYETTGQSENHLTYLLSGVETRPGSNPTWSTLVPRMLLKNPRIREQFINLSADLLNTNFESTRVVETINRMAGHIANEAVRHRKRWNLSEKTASDHLKRMTTFAQERPGYLRGFIRDYFNCGIDGRITVGATPGGRVKLNSLTLTPVTQPWSGLYFRKNPVHLTACPDPGFKFDGWSGTLTSADSAVSLLVGSSTKMTASFSAINTSVATQDAQQPGQLQLLPNYPNPFNPVTTLAFDLPRSGFVRLSLCDLLGREVTTLVSGHLAAGRHTIRWDGNGWAGGVYFCRLEADGQVQSRKLLLVK